MASVVMPESIPCKYNEHGWQTCKNPTDNGWCSEHENVKCVFCGQKAIKKCDAGMGGLLCGAPLCETCRHDDATNEHVTLIVYNEKRNAEKNEKAMIIASRTSPFQRIDPVLNVPYNLFELMKGDYEKDGYILKNLYYLELRHRCAGFFPAIFSSDEKRIIFTESLALLEKVWNMIEPEDAKIGKVTAYFNLQNSIGYIVPFYDGQSERERTRPSLILSEAEFNSIESNEKPFVWAFGLISSYRIGKETFIERLNEQAKELDPKFKPAMVVA